MRGPAVRRVVDLQCQKTHTGGLAGLAGGALVLPHMGKVDAAPAGT